MLSDRSRERLKGVHADLVRVAERAAILAKGRGLSFEITEGVRTVERQKKLVSAGASQTMRSRHLTGDAFDFVPIVAGAPCWKWPAFWPLVLCFEETARELKIDIECGARWKNFPDGPHVQRPWSARG